MTRAPQSSNTAADNHSCHAVDVDAASAQQTTVGTGIRNLFHCCTQKTASQWFRVIWKSHDVAEATGMTPYHYQSHLPQGMDERPMMQIRFDKPFPAHTIIETLYTGRPGFDSIPQPGAYRAFFVLRDPRDVVVSYFFSLKYSHKIMNEQMQKDRDFLHRISEEDGLAWMIDALAQPNGYFDAQRSWLEPSANNTAVRVYRYEDLFGADQLSAMLDLFTHLHIPLSESKLAGLLDHYRFEKFAGGRAKGVEDVNHQYRKGTAGGWREHFTAKVESHFRRRTGDLLEVLGYEW